MKMHTKLHNAINEQIKNEIYSAYLYLSMAIDCTQKNLPGFAHWMKVQVQEEVGHAQRLMEYLWQREEKVSLQAIDQPPTEFASPREVFEKTLAHEKRVTSLIHALCALAENVQDSDTLAALQWFVAEQAEEEKTASTILEKLTNLTENQSDLLSLDQTLGQRK